jgi:hypothetical protein
MVSLHHQVRLNANVLTQKERTERQSLVYSSQVSAFTAIVSNTENVQGQNNGSKKMCELS